MIQNLGYVRLVMNVIIQFKKAWLYARGIKMIGLRLLSIAKIYPTLMISTPLKNGKGHLFGINMIQSYFLALATRKTLV